MTDLDPATADDLDRLCAHARRVVDAHRHRTVAEAHPAVAAALGAVRQRLRAAGVDGELADRTVVRWFVTVRPIAQCLAVEADPPYPTGRAVPGVARTHAPGSSRGPGPGDDGDRP